MLKLYALPQSPYCVKVRAALRFKGIPFEELEPHGGSYQTTEFQSVVPAGSVPALEEDGWLLHDSQAILEYLEESYPEPSLWSADRRERAMQRSIVHFHDSKLEPKVRELVPLVKQSPSAERTLEIGLVRDALYDRLFRLAGLLEITIDMPTDRPSVVEWTLPPTISIAEDILSHLGSSLEIPQRLRAWLDQKKGNPLVTDEVDRIRGAIAQWLRNEMSLAHQS